VGFILSSLAVDLVYAVARPGDSISLSTLPQPRNLARPRGRLGAALVALRRDWPAGDSPCAR
jgi:hypothetical protein